MVHVLVGSVVFLVGPVRRVPDEGPHLGIRAYVDALWTVVCVWSGQREAAVLR